MRVEILRVNTQSQSVWSDNEEVDRVVVEVEYIARVTVDECHILGTFNFKTNKTIMAESNVVEEIKSLFKEETK